MKKITIIYKFKNLIPEPRAVTESRKMKKGTVLEKVTT